MSRNGFIIDLRAMGNSSLCLVSGRRLVCAVILSTLNPMSIRSRKLSVLSLWSHAPGRRRWLFRGAIDRVLFQQAHAFLHRALKLRIAPGDYIFGPILNIDVGRDAFVFYRPA